MAFKSRLKCLFLKPIFCILFATFLHFARNTTKGYDLDTSVKRTKEYISGALGAMLDLGKGSGPMDYSFAIDNEYTTEYER